MRPADLDGRRVAVWGAGREGRSAVRHLRERTTADLVLVEDDEATRLAALAALRDEAGVHDIRVVGGTDGIDALADAEVVLLSPGISIHRADVRDLVARGAVLTNATALALGALVDRDVIAVTGSKGKSTTTALLRHLLHVAGHDAEEGGNIGRPALDLVDTASAIVVLEVSSYQASLVTTPARYGVLTALFAEHLDWHGDLDTYFADKLRLFRGSGLRAVAVDGSDRAAIDHSTGLPRTEYATPVTIHPHDGALWSGTRRLTRAPSQLVGEHNLRNAAGALTAACFVDPTLVDQAEVLDEWIATFHPLPHRLQTIASAAGVEFVDDSIATSPEATVAALRAFDGRHVSLLAGGHDRSLPFEPLAAFLDTREAPTLVLTMPTSGDRLADLLEERGSESRVQVRRCESLDHAVREAVASTPSGGVVLLSPAAASYDRFTSYVHRGAEFARLVRDALGR